MVHSERILKWFSLWQDTKVILILLLIILFENTYKNYVQL